MSPRYTPAEFRLLLKKAEAQKRKRKREEAELVTAHLQSGVLPTPEAIAKILAWSGPTERSRLMRMHRFWKEWQLRCGFDALVSAALTANLDLARCEAALTAYASSRDGFEDHIDHTVGNPAQKEVMAFCAAYFGTVDTLRRLKSARPELADEIDRLRIAATDAPEFRFVLDLRKNLSHGSVVVPGWSISSDYLTTSGGMRFSASDLLAFGEWSASSRRYLQGAVDGQVSISSVTAVCARGLARLRRDLKALFFSHRSAAEADYFDLEDLARRIASRQFTKILLQGQVEKGTDPYPLLWRFFSPDVVRQILRFPPHSAEQVEFIITHQAPKTDCDDELRAMLYKLFGVQKKIEELQEQPRPASPLLVDRWRTHPRADDRES